MSVKKKTQAILDELSYNLRFVEEESFGPLLDHIMAAGHIFTAGAGRSGIAMRAFTNRLMYLGLSVSAVGEITSPHTAPGDLLLIGSGSGETESLVAMARKAKKNGVQIALVTMDDQSTLAGLADSVVVLPGVSPKVRHHGTAISSFQPMGNAFEQMCFLVYDALVMELMEKMGETSDSMFARHADLE